MSWAADEWKSDLSHRAQQKVEQLEAQMTRLKKEAEMKQFKMDSMDQVIQKEKMRVDDERTQVSALKRETQSLSESCQEVEQKRQKLATDLQAKESHINALNGQIAHTKKQLSQENNKVSQLQASVEKFERDQMGKGDKYEKLSTEHDKLKQMNQHQTKECSALRSECSTLKHRISECENQLAHIQGENSHMKSQLKEQGSLKESQSKNLAAELKAEKENLKIKEKKTGGDIKSLKNLLEKREKELEKFQMDSKSKEDKLTSMLKALTNEMQNSKEVGNRKSAQDLQTKSKLEQTIGELKNSAAEKDQENTKLNKDLKFLRDSLTNAQTNAESLKVDLKNKESIISQQKESIKNMEKDLTKRCQETGNENERLGKQLKSVLSQLESVKDQYKNAQSMLDKKEREIDNSKADCKNLTAERDTLEKKMIGLDKTKEALGSALSQIKNELQKLINMNGSLKQEVEEQKNLLNGKEREISQLQSELSHNNDRLCHTQKQLDNVKSELRTSEENIRQLKSDTEANKCELELVIKQLKTEQITAEECKEGIKSELEKVISEKNELMSHKEKNESILKELHDDLDQGKVEKSDLVRNLEISENEKESLTETMQKLRIELNDMKSYNIELAKSLDETKFTLELSESKNASLEQKVNGSETKYQKTVESLNNITTEKEELLAQQQNLYSDIDELNASLESSKTETHQDKVKIESILYQIQELKDDLSKKEIDYSDCQIRLNEEVQCLKNIGTEKDEQTKLLQKELETSEENLESSRKQLSASEHSICEMEERSKVLEINLEEINFTLVECNRVKEEQVESIDNLKKELCSLKDEVNSKSVELEQTNADFLLELENHNIESVDKNSELESLKTELLHSNENLSDVRRLYDETDMVKSRLEEDILELNKTIDETKFILEDSQCKEEKHTLLINELQKDIMLLKDEFDVKIVKEIEIKTALQHEIEVQKNINHGKDSEINELNSVIPHKVLLIEELQIKYDRVLSEKETVQVQCHAQADEIEKLKFSNNDSELNVTRKQEIICDLQCEVQTLKDTQSALSLEESANKANLNQKIEELQNIAEGQKSEISQLKVDVGYATESFLKATESLATMTNEKCETELNAQKLQTEIEVLKHDISALKTAEDGYQSVISDQLSETQTLKDQLNELSMDVTETKTKLNQKSEELQNVTIAKDSEINTLQTEVRHISDLLQKVTESLESVTREKCDQELNATKWQGEMEEMKFEISEMKSANDRYQAVISKQQSEVETLKDELSDLSIEDSINKANMTKKNEELQNMVDGKEGIISELTAEISHISERLQNVTKALDDTQTINCDAEMNIQKYQKETEDLKLEISTLKSAEDNHLSVISVQVSEIQSLKDELNDFSIEESINKARLKQQLEDLQSLFDGAQKDNEQLTSKVNQTEETIENNRSDIELVRNEKCELLNTLKQHESIIEEWKFTNSELNASNDKYVTVISDLQFTINTLKDELSDISTKESMNKVSLNKEIAELQNISEGKDSEINRLKEEITHVSERFETATETLESNNKKTCEYEMSVQKYQTETDELSHEIGELKTIDERNQSIICTHESQIQTLKDQISILSTEICETKVNLNQKIEELLNVAEGRDCEIKQLNAEITRISETLQKTTDVLDCTKSEKCSVELTVKTYLLQTDEMQHEINELKSANDQYQSVTSKQLSEMQALKDELGDISIEDSVIKADLNQKIEEIKNIKEGKDLEISELKTEITHISENLQKVTEALETSNTVKCDFEMNIKKHHSEQEEMNHEITELKLAQDKQQSVISMHVSEIQTLKDDLSDLSTEESINRVKLKQQIDELQTLLVDSQKENEQLCSKLNQTEELNEKKSFELESVNHERSELLLTVKQLETRLEECKFSVSELTSSIEKYTTMIAELQLANITLKDQLNDMSAEESANNVKLNQEIEQLQNISDGKDLEISELKTEITHISENLQKVTEALETSNKVKCDFEMNIKKHHTEKEEMNLEITELKLAQDKQQSVISMQVSEIQTLKDDLSDLSTEESINRVQLKQQIDELQTLLVDSQKENEQLCSKLNQAEELNEKKSLELESVNHERSELLLTVKQLETRLEEYKFSVSELTSSTEKYTTMIAELQLANSTLKDQLNDMSAEESANNVKLNQEIEQLHNISEGKDLEMSELKTEITHISENLQKVTEALETSNKVKCDFEMNIKKHHSEQEEMNHEITELKLAQDKQQSVISMQVSEIQTLKDDLSDISTEESINRVKLKQQIDELQTLLVDSQKENEQLCSKLNQAEELNEKKSLELESVNHERSEILLTVKQLETRLEECKFSVSELTSSTEKYTTMIAELQLANSTLKDQLNDMSAEESANNVKLNQEIEQLQNIYEGKDLEISELKIEITHISENLQKVTEALETSNKVKCDFEMNIKKHHTEKEEMNHEITELKLAQDKQQSVISKQVSEIQTLKDDLSDLSTEESINRIKLKQQIDELQPLLVDSQKENEQLCSKLNQAEELNEKKTLALESLNHERSELLFTVKQLETRLEECKYSVSELTSSTEKHTAMITELQLANNTLKDKLNDMSAEESANNVKLNQEIEQLQNISEGKDLEIVQLKAEVTHVSERLHKSVADLESLNTIQNDSEMNVKKYQSELDQLIHEISELKCAGSRYELVISQQLSEIQTLKDELSDLSTEESIIKAKLKQQLEELQNISDDLQKKNDQLLSQLNETTETIEQKRVNLEFLTTEKSEFLLTTTQHEATIDELNLKIGNFTVSEQNYVGVVSDLQTENVSLKDKLRDLSTEETIIEMKLNQKNEELQNVTEAKELEINVLKSELSCVSECSKKTSESLECITHDKCEAELKVQQCTHEIEELKHEIIELKSADAIHQSRIGELQLEIQLVKDQMNDRSMVETSAKVALSQEIVELNNCQATKEDELENVLAELSHKSEKLNNLQERLEIVCNEKHNFELTLQKHVTELGEASDAHEEMMQSKLKLQHKIDELENEKSILKNKLIDLSDQDSMKTIEFKQELEAVNDMVSNKISEITELSSELTHTYDKLAGALKKVELLEHTKIELDTTIEKYTRENNEMQHCLSDSRASEEKYHLQVDALEKEINVLKDDLYKENVCNSADTAKLNRDINDHKNLVNGYNEEITKLASANEHLKSDLNVAEKKQEDLQLQNTEMDSELDKLKQRLDDENFNLCNIEKQNETYKEKNVELENKVSFHKEELYSCTRNLESATLNLRQNLEENANLLERKDTELVQMEAKLSNNVSDYNDLQKSAFEKDAKLQDLSEQLMQFQNQRDTFKFEASTVSAEQDSEINSLREKINDFNVILEKANNEKIAANEMLQKKTSQLQVSQEDCEDMQEQVLELENKLTRMEKENEVLETSVQNFTDRLTSLDIEKSTLSRVLEEKQILVHVKDNEIMSLRTELEKAEEKLHSMQEKVTDVNDHFISTEAEVLQLKQSQESQQFCTDQQIKELETEIMKMNEKLELSHLKVTDLEKQNLDLNVLIDSQKEISKDSETKNEQIMFDYTQTIAKVASLENEKNVLQCRIESLKSDVDQAEQNATHNTQKHTEMQTDLESTRLSKMELETQMSVLQKEKSDLMENIEMLRKEKTVVESSLMATDTAVEQLKFAVSQGQCRETEMQVLIETLKGKIQQLQDACNDTSLNTHSIEAELEKEISENKVVRAEKESSMDTLQEEMSVVKQNLQECEEKYDLVTCKLDETNIIVTKYETELQDLKFSHVEAEAKIVELLESADYKKNEIQDLKDIINDVTLNLDSAKATYERQLSELSNTLTATTEEFTATKDELDQKGCALLEFQECVLRQTEKANNVELQLRTLQKEMEDTEISTKEKLKSQETDIGLLQETLSNIQSLLENAKMENTVLQQNLELSEERLQECRAEALQMDQDKKHVEKELQKVEEDKLEYANTIESLNAHLTGFQFDEGNCKRKLDYAEQELQSTQAFSQNLQSQLEQVDGSYKSLQDKLYELTSKNTELETNLQQVTIEFERVKLEMVDKSVELNDLLNKKNENESTLQEKMLVLEDKVKNGEGDIVVLDGEKIKLEYEAKYLENEKLSLMAKIDVLENKMIDSEQCVVEANNRVNELDGTLKKVQSDFKIIELEKEQSHAELSILKSSADQSTTQLCELREETVRKQNEIIQMKSENESLMSQFNKSEIECQGKASVIQELDDTVEKLKETLDSFENVRFQQKNRIQELSDTVDELNNNLNVVQMEQSQKSTDTEIISAELMEAQEENRIIINKNKTINEANTNLQLDLENNTKQIETLQIEIENFKLSIFSSEEELENLKKCVQDQDNEIQKMQTDAEKLESKVRNIETEKDDLEDMVEFTTMETASRDEKVDELQKKYSETNSNLEKIQMESITAEKEIKQLNEKNSDLTNLINELHNAKECLENEVKMNHSDIEKFSQEANDLKNKIKELECDIESFKDMMESLEFENTSLETEKEAIRSELTNFRSEKTSLLFEMGTLKNAVLQKEQQMEDQCGKLEEILAKDQEKHSDITDSLNAEIIELQEKYTKMCKNENCLMDENKILKAKMDSMDLSFSSFDSQRSELIEVKSELQSLTSDRISMHQKVATQDREKNELLSQFLALEDKKSQVDRQNTDLKLQVDDISKALEGKVSECKNLTTELESQIKSVGDLECQMGLLQCDLEKLREVNIELVADCERLRSELVTSERETVNLERDLKEKEGAFTCEMDKLQKRGEELQVKVDCLENLKDEQSNTIESLELEQAELLTHKAQVGELQTEITALKSEMKEGLRHIDALTRKLKEKEDQISSLKLGRQDGGTNNKEKEGQSKEELQQTLEKWASRCSKLNVQLTMEKKNVTKYREQVQSIKANVEQQIKEQTCDLTKELESAQKSSVEYLDKYHTLTRRYTQLEADSQKMQILLGAQTSAESALLPTARNHAGHSAAGIGQTNKCSVDRPTSHHTTPKQSQHQDFKAASAKSCDTSPKQAQSTKNNGRNTTPQQTLFVQNKSRYTTPEQTHPVKHNSRDTTTKQSERMETSVRRGGRDVTPEQVKQETNCRTQQQELAPQTEGQPVAKRLRKSDIGTSVDKLVEDEHLVKRKSPRCLSRSKQKLDAEIANSEPKTMKSDLTAMSRLASTSAALINTTDARSTSVVDVKGSLEASQRSGSVSSMVTKIEQTGTRINSSSATLGHINGKPVTGTDAGKPAVKGLRCKSGKSATITGVSSSDSSGVSAGQDLGNKPLLRTRLNLSQLGKDSQGHSMNVTKMDESVADRSKTLLGNTSTMTRSQSKLGASQTDIKKNPLGTITNSPVKKPGPVGNDSGPKMVPPQRVLSLKKSPQMMKTRRRARDVEPIVPDQEEAPECKVN